MQIMDIINSDLIQFGVDIKTKKQALQLISKLFVAQDSNLDEKEIYHALLAREKLGSTIVGHGVAIPHCKNSQITDPIACIIRLKSYIDFSSSSYQKVNLIFGLIVPENNNNEHLRILSKIASLIDDKNIRDKLYKTQNPEDILIALNQYSEEH
tara:strand:+ start:2588 stop:3049 length:462 start_codon:yes stop_codon:yes gene_type:complete